MSKPGKRQNSRRLASDLGGQTEVTEHGANGGVTCSTPLGEGPSEGTGRTRHLHRESGRRQRRLEVW